MFEDENILISVRPRHVDSIVCGEKTVELRRRSLQLSPGCRVWIYTTLPRGAIEATAIVRTVVSDRPSVIWRKYGHLSGITKSEFYEYYNGVNVAYAIVFSSVEKLIVSLALAEIRQHLGQFHPPQFFKRLAPGSAELNLFTSVTALPQEFHM